MGRKKCLDSNADGFAASNGKDGEALAKNMRSALPVEFTGVVDRFSISSDEWHQARPDAATRLFGYDEWDHVKTAVWALFELSRETLTDDELLKPLTMFEECLMSLVWMNCEKDLGPVAIGAMFGVKDPSQVVKFALEWVSLWEDAEKELARHATSMNADALN